MAGRFALPVPTALDSNASPGSGWKLNFYTTGTSSRLDTFSDDALSVANANPVVADSAGRFPSIFLKGEDYKVVLTDASDVTVWSRDPVRSPSPKSTVVITKTTTYVVTTGDDGKTIAADATAGAFTITLPAAATAGDGFEISVIKIDSSANAVTVDGDGSETINDASDVDLAEQFDAVVLKSDGSEWYATIRPVSITTPLPRNYLDGLTLSNNSTDADHDIDIAAGVARDGGDAANMALTSTMVKRIDAAWAVGTGNGGLDTGTVANTTWYHVWLIRRSDTAVVDALFSTSATAPTMPTDYDQKRRLGSVLTDGSANILAFHQDGDEFLWDVPVRDYTAPNPGISAVLRALSTPAGVKVRAIHSVNFGDSTTAADNYLLLTDPDQTDTTPSASVFSLAMLNTSNISADSAQFRIRTDTSSQIRVRIAASDASVSYDGVTHGWTDERGKS